MAVDYIVLWYLHWNDVIEVGVLEFITTNEQFFSPIPHYTVGSPTLSQDTHSQNSAPGPDELAFAGLRLLVYGNCLETSTSFFVAGVM